MSFICLYAINTHLAWKILTFADDANCICCCQTAGQVPNINGRKITKLSSCYIFTPAQNKQLYLGSFGAEVSRVFIAVSPPYRPTPVLAALPAAFPPSQVDINNAKNRHTRWVVGHIITHVAFVVFCINVGTMVIKRPVCYLVTAP